MDPPPNYYHTHNKKQQLKALVCVCVCVHEKATFGDFHVHVVADELEELLRAGGVEDEPLEMEGENWGQSSQGESLVGIHL